MFGCRLQPFHTFLNWPLRLLFRIRNFRDCVEQSLNERMQPSPSTAVPSVLRLLQFVLRRRRITEASRRYSPAAVVAVERVAVAGEPEQISTSYVERQNLTLRMASKRFARLSNGFSKRMECHLAAVALHVAFYNFARVHESLRSTPAMALGIADQVWTIGDLVDAALGAVPPVPTPTAPERRRQFRLIEGGKS